VWQGEARLGKAWQGLAGRGTAGQGEFLLSIKSRIL